MRYEEKFWMVWNPAANPPRVKHDERRMAQLEAERLAAENPGCTFYVLEAVSVSERVCVVTSELHEPQAPF